MLIIDPSAVTDAARHLHLVADRADALRITLQQALVRSELSSLTPSFCAEIDEELALLARVLVTRAEMVSSFHFVLPEQAAAIERTLLASLDDADGRRGPITGPLALAVLQEHVDWMASHDLNGRPERVTMDELRAWAAEPGLPADLHAALRSLTVDPFTVEALHRLETQLAVAPAPVIEADGFSLATLALHLERHQVLSLLLQAAPDALKAGTERFDDTTLTEFGLTIDDLLRLGLSPEPASLVATTISFGHVTHSPSAAQAFIEQLPLHDRDGVALAMASLDSAAVAALHQAAIRDLGTSPGDFVTHLELIAHLPETTDGYRNHYITWAYAEMALMIDHDLHGPLAGQVDATGFAGLNWFFFGAAASNVVGEGIRGEITSYLLAPPGSLQDIANGNQALFAELLAPMSQYVLGEPIEPSTRQRSDGSSPTHVDGFDIGIDQVVDSFALIEHIKLIDDPVERQKAMLESVIKLGLHEQSAVDPYLELEGTPDLIEAASPAWTFIASNIAAIATLNTPNKGPRSITQVVADDGEFKVNDADGNELAPPIALGEPMPSLGHPNNHVADLPVESIIGNQPFVTDLDTVDDWAEYDERLSASIIPVFTEHLTSPELAAATASIAIQRAPTPREGTGRQPGPRWPRSGPLESYPSAAMPLDLMAEVHTRVHHGAPRTVASSPS